MSNGFPVIKTQRLLLRQFTDDDLEWVYRGLSNTEVIRYYGINYQSLGATKMQMNFFKDLEKNETGIWWAICSADNKIFYGAAGLNSLVKIHKKAELGFWLLPENWGKGIISESLPHIIKHAFNQMGLHRIEAVIEPENSRSKKVVMRHGFEYEGTMHECEWKNGEWINLDFFALLNEKEISLDR